MVGRLPVRVLVLLRFVNLRLHFAAAAVPASQ